MVSNPPPYSSLNSLFRYKPIRPPFLGFVNRLPLVVLLFFPRCHQLLAWLVDSLHHNYMAVLKMGFLHLSKCVVAYTESNSSGDISQRLHEGLASKLRYLFILLFNPPNADAFFLCSYCKFYPVFLCPNYPTPTYCTPLLVNIPFIRFN